MEEQAVYVADIEEDKGNLKFIQVSCKLANLLLQYTVYKIDYVKI